MSAIEQLPELLTLRELAGLEAIGTAVPYEATLEEIDGLAGRAMTSALDRMHMHLDERRYEALHDYLVGVGWEMAATYDPEVGQAFSTYFFRRARRRVVDWIRRTHGDKRYGNELKKLPLNFPESLSAITDHDRASVRVAVEDPEPGSLADAIVELGRHSRKMHAGRSSTSPAGWRKGRPSTRRSASH